MNYRLIRQASMIFRSYKVTLSSNTLKYSQNLINQAKYLHVTSVNFSPRFSRDPIHDEIKEETPPASPAEKQTHEYPSKKSIQEAEDAAWDEIESEMFHAKQHKVPGEKMPKVTFKGIRTFVQKEKSKNKPMFDMEDIDRKSKKKTEKNATETKPKPVKKVSTAEEKYDEDVGKYLNLERDDPLLDKLMLQFQSKKHQELPKFILEGRRLIQEAFDAGLKLETLVFSKMEQVKPLKEGILRSKAKLYKVANHNLKLWSQLTTTPGVLGIFNRPDNLNDLIEKQRIQEEVIPVTVVLDNIREPNNMGAIIRVAAAAGADKVILTKGCTNPWDLKCIRGSSGTHFRIKIIGPIEWTDIQHHLPSNFEYYIADNQSKEENLPLINYDAIELNKESHEHTVLVIGGEAHGISDEARDILHEILQKDKKKGAIVQIPLVQKVNSLNVASALSVVLFEVRRKLLK